MSSEEGIMETIGHRTQPVYRVKLCVWRAPEIGDYLQMIDKAGEPLRGTKGAKQAPRIRSTIQGRSGAVPKLPRKMYNTEWLEEQERIRPFYVEDELQVSEEAFELLVLATGHL
jgi:hypothetical protein